MICGSCNKDLSEDYFNKCSYRWNGLSWSCKECANRYNERYRELGGEALKRRVSVLKKSKREANKEFIWNYKLAHPCVDCGESDPVVLEFDHIGGDKKYSICRMMYMSLETILSEIDKCEVVCSNCHKKRTAKKGNFHKGYI
jgi:hypothetical protein